MTVKLLTEQHLEFQASKEAAEARPSLHMSKCHIVENLLHWLIYVSLLSLLCCTCIVCSLQPSDHLLGKG